MLLNKIKKMDKKYTGTFWCALQLLYGALMQ